MILGTGVDIVECARIEELVAEHGRRFVRRVFTLEEEAYCRAQRRPREHFAARFAAKEAVLKALGTGWVSGIAWNNVRISRTESGKPEVTLAGGAAEVARRLGVERVLVSVSHCAEYAVAHAIAEGPGPERGEEPTPGGDGRLRENTGEEMQ